jgi:uncharacterized protein YjbJ (UPF0337 family)
MSTPRLAALPLAAMAALSLLGSGLAACGDTSGGSAQKTGGKIEEAAGKITGDDDLKREGKKDKVVGGVKETVDDAKDAVKDAAK